MSLQSLADPFFTSPPGDMSKAQQLGAPLIPLGIGAVVLTSILGKPKLAPVGVGMALLGIGLLAFARYKDESRTAVSGWVDSEPGAWGKLRNALGISRATHEQVSGVWYPHEWSTEHGEWVSGDHPFMHPTEGSHFTGQTLAERAAMAFRRSTAGFRPHFR